jgi:hypothetical protein
MIRTKSNGFLQLIAALSIIAGFSAASQAGIIANNGAAISPLYTGSAPFNNGLGLSGSVDYAVFTANAFNSNFGGLGYVPGDVLVYAYQLNVTGTLNASAELVGIVNPANTIGSFNIGGVAPSSASFTPNARWNFAGGIPSGSTSYGLAFSSPNLPIFGTSLTFDGGTPAAGTLLPTPGPIPAIPEPASIGLLLAGISLTCLSRRTRWRK